MEAIYPITALQKNAKEVREQGRKGLVRLTENGSSAYIFCSEPVLEEIIQREREDAAWEARLAEAIGSGLADVAAGRYVTSTSAALSLIQKRRDG